jgi:hypothetical protein
MAELGGMPLISVTWEAEAGISLAPRSSRQHNESLSQKILLWVKIEFY